MISKQRTAIFCIVTAHMVAITCGSSRRDIVNNAPQLAEKREFQFSIFFSVFSIETLDLNWTGCCEWIYL